MALDPLADRLEELLRAGSIAASQLSGPMRTRLQALFWMKALQEAKSGGGKRVVLHDREALLRWVNKEYPSGLHGTTEVLGPRAEGVANYRDSKAGRKLKIRPVFMRGFGGATLRRPTGDMPLAAITGAHDLAGVLIDPDNPWHFSGELALVENLELFVNVEAVVPNIDAALWTAGRLDQRVLDWLGTMPEVSIVHVGDYDPVGLDEYLRVLGTIPQGRARLFVPTDFEARLVKFGKVDLLLKSIAVLQRVRREAPDEVRRVIDLMDRHGKALEHEGLFIRQMTDDQTDAN